MREGEATGIQAELQRRPIPGVKSFKQFSRKLLIDYAQGKLVYINPSDERNVPQASDASYRLKDATFIEALYAFLKKPENWRDLKFFMLMYGWPKEVSDAFTAAPTSEGRLDIVREYLNNMLENL
jgi:hypothetical protein